MRMTMPTETAGLIGLKAGLFAALFVFAVSGAAVGVGFTVIPLDETNPIRDAARRLAGGVFCAFTLGILLAVLALGWFPGLLPFWQGAFSGFDPEVRGILAHTAAATPFFAVSALVGFWVVAAVMRVFHNRRNSDALELGRDVVDGVRSIIGPRQ